MSSDEPRHGTVPAALISSILELTPKTTRELPRKDLGRDLAERVRHPSSRQVLMDTISAVCDLPHTEVGFRV
jgi:hypothetical protein